jgi:hypothetical protein
VWPDERSKQDSVEAGVGGMPLVMQKSITSGSLFRSVGQYVGLPVEKCLKLWCSRTVWRVRL